MTCFYLFLFVEKKLYYVVWKRYRPVFKNFDSSGMKFESQMTPVYPLTMTNVSDNADINY